MVRVLLDIVIDETQFSGAIRTRPGPVWLVIHPDGLSNPVVTRKVSPNSTPYFNLALRLVLLVPSVNESYLKVSLCTPSADGARAEVLASSQIRLSCLPTGAPKSFTFSLIRRGTTSEEAALVSAKALVSELAFAAQPTRATYAGESPALQRQGTRQMQMTYPAGVPYPNPRSMLVENIRATQNITTKLR